MTPEFIEGAGNGDMGAVMVFLALVALCLPACPQREKVVSLPPACIRLAALYWNPFHSFAHSRPARSFLKPCNSAKFPT